MKTQRVTSERYDITGLSIGRVLKQKLFIRLMPAANFSGGPGWKLLVKLWGLHTLARPYYALKIRLEKPAALLRRIAHIATRRPG